MVPIGRPANGHSSSILPIVWAWATYLSLFRVSFTYLCFKLYLGGCFNPGYLFIWTGHISFWVNVLFI